MKPGNNVPQKGEYGIKNSIGNRVGDFQYSCDKDTTFPPFPANIPSGCSFYLIKAT